MIRTTSPVPSPSLHDLTDPANLEDARHQLRKALASDDPREFTAWVLEWGEAAIAAIDELMANAPDLDWCDE